MLIQSSSRDVGSYEKKSLIAIRLRGNLYQVIVVTKFRRTNRTIAFLVKNGDYHLY